MAFDPYSPTNPTNPDAPIDLVNALFGSNPAGFVFSNINVTTSILSTFFYDGAISQLGIGSGLLLTSGIAPGPTNSSNGFSADNGLPGDTDFDTIVPAFDTFNATSISFTLTNNNPLVNALQFSVVFGSEEFPEYVDSFPDIGAVFVNGVNYALFNNNPDQPLSVLSSNLAAGNFLDNAANAVAPIEYDGISSLLTFVVPLVQGVNSIKIGIADLADTALDSGIFLSNFKGIQSGFGGGLLTNIDGDDEDNALEGTGNNEILNGEGGDDDLDGGDGDDILDGGDGDDALAGEGGDDESKGGAGDLDCAEFSGNRADYEITYDEDSDTLTVVDLRFNSPDGTDIVHSDVELLKFADGILAFDSFLPDDGEEEEPEPVTGSQGTPGNDLIDGNNQPNDIDGEQGNDVIRGFGGNDLIHGRDGDDTLEGNDGDDIVSGGNGADIIRGGQGADKISGQNGADSLFGGTGNDQISGGADNDLINGEDGDDKITGDGGDDTINAGAGNDLVYGNDGNDKLSGLAGDDRMFGGTGLDQIDGGVGNDLLFGEAGADKIVGGSGADRINGGLGADDLTGGADADKFIFLNPGEGSDIIRDFQSGVDQIVFDGSNFGLGALALGANLFIGGGAVGINASLIYDSSNGKLYFDADGAGAGAAELMATLLGAPVLTAASFALS